VFTPIDGPYRGPGQKYRDYPSVHEGIAHSIRLQDFAIIGFIVCVQIQFVVPGAL
jgi:hypothetical protein